MTCLYYLMLCNWLWVWLRKRTWWKLVGCSLDGLMDGVLEEVHITVMVTYCRCHWNWACWNRIQVVNGPKHHDELCNCPIWPPYVVLLTGFKELCQQDVYSSWHLPLTHWTCTRSKNCHVSWSLNFDHPLVVLILHVCMWASCLYDLPVLLLRSK